MTDTTDIKALREGLVELLDHVDSYGGKCWLFPEDVRSIISSLDQLEAERHWADDRAKENYRNKCDVDNCMETIANLEAELAALKGEQVPVAWRFKNESGEYRVSIEKKPNTYGRTDFEPLFTAPQKPVLHPDTKRMDWLCAHAVEVRDPQMYGSHAMFHAQQDSEEWDLPHHTTLREQVDAAIEAARGIVKDGE